MNLLALWALYFAANLLVLSLLPPAQSDSPLFLLACAMLGATGGTLFVVLTRRHA